MPDPASSAPQHPGQSDGDAGLGWTHDDSQIGADEIPEALWDKLHSMYPGSKKLIRKIRSLLIDCHSESVNAGTVLMIFAALSGVTLLEHPAYQELVKLLNLNKHLIEAINVELHKFHVLVRYGYFPDKHQIREIVQEELAENNTLLTQLIQKLSDTGNSLPRNWPPQGPICFKTIDKTTWMWVGEGEPDAGPGEWIKKKFKNCTPAS
jgi:hypothetical protein